MAIALQFINFIVPRAVIEERYPGGWGRCLRDHRALLGGRVYYDGHLFRDGAMDPSDIDCLLDEWRSRGFEPVRRDETGSEVAGDVCVMDTFSGCLWPCMWLTRKGFIAYMTGTDPGRLVGPRGIRQLIARRQVAIDLRTIGVPMASGDISPSPGGCPNASGD